MSERGGTDVWIDGDPLGPRVVRIPLVVRDEPPHWGLQTVIPTHEWPSGRLTGYAVLREHHVRDGKPVYDWHPAR